MQASVDGVFATTIVSVEEQMRGWLAEINKARNAHEQIAHYQQLHLLFNFFQRWEIVPFEEAAAQHFNDLRKQRIRIGTFDLKIASIALAQDVLLLSANLRDFRKVPGLHVESWIG
jgi:tRNA(fMet)-specific endonuclease VapC